MRIGVFLLFLFLALPLKGEKKENVIVNPERLEFSAPFRVGGNGKFSLLFFTHP